MTGSWRARVLARPESNRGLKVWKFPEKEIERTQPYTPQVLPCDPGTPRRQSSSSYSALKELCSSFKLDNGHDSN